MRSISIVVALVAAVVSQVSATALTYKLGASERACFFADVQRENAKVAFYFAVSRLMSRCLHCLFADSSRF